MHDINVPKTTAGILTYQKSWTTFKESTRQIKKKKCNFNVTTIRNVANRILQMPVWTDVVEMCSYPYSFWSKTSCVDISPESRRNSVSDHVFRAKAGVYKFCNRNSYEI